MNTDGARCEACARLRADAYGMEEVFCFDGMYRVPPTEVVVARAAAKC